MRTRALIASWLLGTLPNNALILPRVMAQEPSKAAIEVCKAGDKCVMDGFLEFLVGLKRAK